MPIPLDVDATWLNPGSVTLDAGELRRADAALLAGADGVAFGGIARHSDTSLAVTLSGDTVTVQPGSAVIPGNAVSQSGAYRVSIPAAQSQALAARNSTNPRITRVVLRALDTDVVPSHGAYKGRLEFIDYPPAATPGSTMTALPSMTIELARITVPQTGGGAATVDSTYRTYACAAGGTLVVPSAVRLPFTNVPARQRAMVLDTGVEHEYRGGGWWPTRVAGTATISTDAAGISGYVNFIGTFSQPPVVVFNVVGGNTSATLYDTTVNATRFRLSNLDGTAFVGSATVNYLAIAAG